MSSILSIIQSIHSQIKRKLPTIIVVASFVAALSFTYATLSKEKYKIYSKIFPLSFNKSSSSPLDAIKAQFGISDKTDYSVIYNLKELVGSKTIREQVVKSTTINPKYKNIADWIIDDHNSGKLFFQKKINLSASDSLERLYIASNILKEYVAVNEEKTEFTTLLTHSHNKELSIQLNEIILKELGDYYVQVSTEKPRGDLTKIKIMRDSLKNELDLVEAAIAGYQDANQYSVRYATGIPQSKLIRTRAEIEELYTSTATAYYNARFKLLSESPIFQVLDAPREPFDIIKPSRIKLAIVGFGFTFIFMSFWVCRKILFKLILDELSK